MKKFISILLAVTTLSALTACSGNGDRGEANTQTDSNNAVQIPASPPTASTPLSADGTGISTFDNPLITIGDAHTWTNYGIGDPFVMRWNGKYYLYCSTKDGERGIQCWSSEDLVNWKYEKICATEKLTVTAYAPEVVYYNGYFYMYTSPAGNGHYVLRSTSPTGPFEAITGNFGHSIDGDVFIDDDGKWYFYSADGGGIMCYAMTAPDQISNSGSTVGAYMNGWTEGPMVVKYNGIYYLTYTGNHVWSNGYRINYATSTRRPTAFSEASNNPILLSTDKSELVGIGHSSTVMGPNLDSFYIVYHSSLGAPKREMRIDRIVLNGNYMEVLGPTTAAQEAPEMPDVYCYFEKDSDLSDWNLVSAAVSGGQMVISDGGRILSNTGFTGDYTAEFNILSVSGGQAGAIFSYTDDRNYGSAYFDSETGELVVTFVVNGSATEHRSALVKSFNEDVDLSVLQMITVRRSGNTFTFLINNRTLASYESTLLSGRIGCGAVGGSAAIGFVGGTGEVWQSSIKRYYKPISGNLLAITCLEDGLTTVTKSNTTYVTVSQGEVYNYLVNVANSGNHDLAVTYKSGEAVTLTVYQNGTELTAITLPSTDGKSVTNVFRGITLNSGMCDLAFRITSGSADVFSYTFEYATAVEAISIDYSKNDDGASYSDGTWKIANGVLTLDGGDTSVGKHLYGEKTWGDYTVEADITPTTSINFGILVRATNPSVGGAGNDVAAGTDFVQGYFIGLGNNTVTLGKQNYNWTVLKTVNASVSVGNTYHVKVEAVGTTISVWLDGELLITYTDTDNPFTQGMVGFRGHYCVASVDNFTVTAN